MVDVVIPAKLARVVVAWEGDHGRAWLERLPGHGGDLAAVRAGAAIGARP